MDTQVAAETYRDRDGNVLVPGDRVQWVDDAGVPTGLFTTVAPFSECPSSLSLYVSESGRVPVRSSYDGSAYQSWSCHLVAVLPARDDDATDDDDDAEASDASDPSQMTGDEVDLVMAVGTLALIAECLDEQSDNQQLAARFARTMLSEFSKRMNIAECREHFVSGLQKVLDRDRERSADG